MNRQNLIDYKVDKEWLKDRIQEIEERKKILNRLTAIYGNNASGSSCINDKLAEDLANLMDKTREYELTLKELEERLIEIVDMLEYLENKKYRNILFKVYIQGKDLTTVANEIKYDYTYTTKLHGYALKEFDKICEKYKDDKKSYGIAT